MYSLTASPVFPTCWRFWMSPTTQRLQVLGSGMSGPVQLATGQGGCLWMLVVKLHMRGAWNNSEPFVVLIACILPMISPQEEKSQVSEVFAMCFAKFYVCPTSKIKVSDRQLLSDKSWWSFPMFIHKNDTISYYIQFDFIDLPHIRGIIFIGSLQQGLLHTSTTPIPQMARSVRWKVSRNTASRRSAVATSRTRRPLATKNRGRKHRGNQRKIDKPG